MTPRQRWLIWHDKDHEVRPWVLSATDPDDDAQDEFWMDSSYDTWQEAMDAVWQMIEASEIEQGRSR